MFTYLVWILVYVSIWRGGKGDGMSDTAPTSCALCGSSVVWEDCQDCGGDGFRGHDCGEDPCCCLDPEENVPCDICDGKGGWWACISSYAWCTAHPLPGHEKAKRTS